MESKNMIGGIVSLAVVVICVAAIMMPVLGDATATEKTFDNSDYARYQMKALEDGDTWTHSDGVWYYDDAFLSNYSTTSYSVVFTDNLLVREAGNSRGTDVITGTNSITSVESLVVNENSTIDLNSSGQYYFDYTYGYGAVQDGDLIMKTMSASAYVKGDTVMYITGSTDMASATTSEVLCVISGSIDDGFTVTASPIKNATITDVTVGEVTVNATAVEGYEDLYLFTSINFDITGTYSGDSITKTATYGTFIMPETVTAELSQHLSTAEISLINAIPVLVIVSLVVAAVGMTVARSRD